ncbi:MAG TPA: DUF1385 domain-containing protein [Chloroflexia bacterium]|nr:DUF1385 domain-containing protein [Chloroflexia bacterium]
MAKFYYGGQAVIEGVMMRGQKHMAVAVRAPDGRIVLHEEALDRGLYKSPLMKLPFLRGILGLWDALGLGMRALFFAANVALEEDEDPKQVSHEAQAALATTPSPITPAPTPTTQNGAVEQGKGSKPASKDSFSGAVGWTTVALALAFMVGIFFVLPVLAASGFELVVGTQSSVVHNLVEGAIRLTLFIAYIWAIGKMRDIQRVFGYHGAEHKTINAYEAGAELTPESVQRFTLLNPRCGTTFLLIVLLMATVVFILIGKLPFVFMVLSRILLVPVIAAIAYEFIRLMANLYGNPIVRAIMAPGIALQKMTTRPPDLSMIEVGIAALKAVLVADGVIQPAPAAAPHPAEEPIATLA